MAITFIHQPAEDSIQSSDNPLLFVFSSDETAQDNFSFVVQTLINDVVASIDTVFPERGSQGKFDASKVSLSAIKPTPRSTDFAQLEMLSTLKIQVSERYGATPETQPSEDSNQIRLLKARLTEETWVEDWIDENYEPGYVWLTDAPNKTFLVSRKHTVNASILIEDEAVSVELQIQFVNTLGEAMFEWTQDYSPQDKLNINLSVAELTAILLVEGYTLKDVGRMEIRMNDSDALNVIYADEDCAEFHQVNWLNNIGAYDQFLFTHNRDTESAVSILEYKKQFGAWDSEDAFVYDPLTSGDTQYLKTIQPTGTVYSGWISEVYQNWLSQIYFSVDALLFDFENNLATVEKITVTDTKAVKDKERFTDILNFQVNFKKTNFKSITT